MFLKPGMQVPVSQLIRGLTCNRVTMLVSPWPILPLVAGRFCWLDEQLR